MTEDDPDYEARLQGLGSATLVAAMRYGDWEVVEGAFFDCWSPQRHIVHPFTIPEAWMRFRSGDWGSAKPFSFGWWAVASDDHKLREGRVIPRGALVRYREWYGCQKDKPNVGLKLYAEIVGKGLVERETSDPPISIGVLDPSAFAEDGGPSIEERIWEGSGRKIHFGRADNKRVPQSGAIGGWDQMRARLQGGEDGRPMIYCFSTCADSIRTIPSLQHDPMHIEDLDTDGEDHAADEWRYACMSRPFIRRVPSAEPMRGASEMTMSEAWKIAAPKTATDRRI